MKRIVSGIQPTGVIHLGNYLGAIKNWVAMQDQGECLFFLADLHAITLPISQVELRSNVLSMTAMLLACGIDPKRSSLFAQKMVVEHSELQWILACTSRMGWLSRMTQYKDKGGKDTEAAFRTAYDLGLTAGRRHGAFADDASKAWGEYEQGRPSVGVGLFTYPILQAADVLLYDATHVPVGDDQGQHLQLVRDISDKFNHDYGVELFTKPEPVIAGISARVMSLKNGRKKMSKSDDDEMARISFTDTNDEIVKKIKRATTDTDFLPDSFDDTGHRAEAENLVNIFAAVSGQSQQDALDGGLAGQGFGTLKKALTEAVVGLVEPIREEYNRLRADDDALLDVLFDGAENAQQIAYLKMEEVRRTVFGY